MSTGFRRHPAITPVLTSHFDRLWVTQSAHNALEASHKVINTHVGVLDDSVKRLQGSCGNRGGSGRGNTTPPSSNMGGPSTVEAGPPPPIQDSLRAVTFSVSNQGLSP
jgi:hypothetical protein